MNDETRQEVVKALAFGEDKEEIANMAECTLEEIAVFEIMNATEIEERRKIGEEFGL